MRDRMPRAQADRQNKNRRENRAFRKLIYEACDGMCQNKACPNEGISPHHIIFKSQGGKNVLENGIWLCAECHWFAHHGQGKGNKRLTARAFMIKVLERYAETNTQEAYRWCVVYRKLADKENV